MPKITFNLSTEFQNDVEQIIPVVTKGDTLELFFNIRDGYKVGLEDVAMATVVFCRLKTGEKYSFDGEYTINQIQQPQVRLYIQAVPMIAGDYGVKLFVYNAAGERVSTMPVVVRIVEEI